MNVQSLQGIEELDLLLCVIEEAYYLLNELYVFQFESPQSRKLNESLTKLPQSEIPLELSLAFESDVIEIQGMHSGQHFLSSWII